MDPRHSVTHLVEEVPDLGGNLIAAGKGGYVVEAGERHKPRLRDVADALLGARLERVKFTGVDEAR